MPQENGFLRTVSEKEIKRMKKQRPTVISLFTGAGGFDLGFAMAGFETRVMVEMDKWCCETLRRNFIEQDVIEKKGQRRKPVILQRDITTLTTKEILEAGELHVGEATAVIGGPPCQGFSAAGKRVLNDPRNKLFKEFVRVVREALPKTFVLENVPGMASMDNGRVIMEICDEFASCGYSVSWRILNAADYGVPQIRHRIIMIGTRIDVMLTTPDGGLQLHMGAVKGPIDHPPKFREKHGIKQKGQQGLAAYKEPETLAEMLQLMAERGAS